ncbi:MAG: YjbQ family protein [Deltaproteobacteria bacterium]|nr:YjbQ family protein [Deltaproteobacteria bacterium]
MKQTQKTLEVPTRGKGFVEITDTISSWVKGQDIEQGLLTVFIRHTSASLVIQENADPTVLDDFESFFSRIAPEGSSGYRHAAEGPDDMPAHIRSALTQTQVGIPVTNGRLCLGTWQGIFVCEHRSRPHARKILLHLIGE